MYKLITNGQIVTEDSVVKGSLLIHDGKIAAIVPEGGDLSGYDVSQTIDAKGQYVVPGGVDGHVHFGGFGDIPIADDFYTGSKAALTGGTTTVVDFCEPILGEQPMDCIARRKKDAEESMVDVAFHYAFTKNFREELRQLDRILGAGIGAFKVFTYYPNTNLLPGEIREIMKGIHDKGPLLVHAEEESIIDNEKAKVEGEEKKNFLNLSLTRPNVSEQIAVESVVALAKETGTKLCIAHSSAGETADIRKRERLSGGDVILETCPHYLELTNEKMKGPDGALFTMNPPLRYAKDNQRLWQAVMEGDIAILSTDHCPYHKQYKYGTDYLTVPCGVDGVQMRMQYLFSEGVIKRGLNMVEFAKITATNAAKFYNLYPAKGVIREGSDADLAFFDPEIQWRWGADQIAGNTDYTVMEGLPVQGKVTTTLKNGEIVYDGEQVLSEKGSGRFLPNVW